jgi:hemoglobin
MKRSQAFWACSNRGSFTGVLVAALFVAEALLSGCGTGKADKTDRGFFTSGSREADQRASQRMAKAEQLSGSGEGSGENTKKESRGASNVPGGTGGAQAQGKLSLFERLGADKGITAIVEDFTPRALQDPRVNWDRKTKEGGWFSRKKEIVAWHPTPDNVAKFKTHFAEFLALATGGPAHYEGKEMQSAHAGMKITNPEFDAAVGDLKASLDRLQVPNQEQKELLAIIESTRPQIVEQR